MRTKNHRSRLARNGIAAIVGVATLTIPVLLASSASAADTAETVTDWVCDTDGPRLTELSIANGNAAVMTVPQFDPALGDFLRAETRFGLSTQQTLSLNVYADPAQNPYLVSATTTVDAKASFPAGTLTASISNSATHLFTSEGTTADPTFTGPDSSVDHFDKSADSGVSTSTDPSWVGTGGVTATAETLSGLTVLGAGGNVAAVQQTYATAEFCVRYAYTPRQYNLTLAKTLASSGPFVAGRNVTFTLSPHNDGPSTALAGWSVTDLLPAGLEPVSMSGEGYDCTGLVCVAAAPLAAGSDGPTITVIAKVTASATATLTNLAYVSPSPRDVPESNPLVVPSPGTNTSTTPTDNDAEAPVAVEAALPPLEGPVETPTVAPSAVTPSTPAVTPVPSGAIATEASESLALTGGSLPAGAFLLGSSAAAAGAILVVLRHRARRAVRS